VQKGTVGLEVSKAIRIGIDARPLQNHHRYRGIGHFLSNTIEALSRLDNKNVYVLYLLREASDCLPKLAPGFNYEIKIVPPARQGIKNVLDSFRPKRSMGWVSEIDIFFQPDISQGLPAKPIASVSMLYDLIPLIFKKRYFPKWNLSLSKRLYSANKQASVARLVYRQQLHLYRRASRILAISEATRQDAIKRLRGVDASHFKTIYLAPSEIGKANPDTLSRLKITKPYILYIGSIDYRKNVPALITAFEEARNRKFDIQLVLVGKDFTLPESKSLEAGAIRKLKAASRYSRDIIIPGYVDDNQRYTLYRDAEAFVFPSLYEGFGLPVLEAMAAGCPVIALSNSSIPEAAGGAALLLQSSNQLAGGIMELLNNPEKAKEMTSKGYKQAKKFTWDKTATEILAALEDVGGKQ
jgi:glycosyltransferase involved in cell wall biosynthesis